MGEGGENRKSNSCLAYCLQAESSRGIGLDLHTFPGLTYTVRQPADSAYTQTAIKTESMNVINWNPRHTVIHESLNFVLK